MALLTPELLPTKSYPFQSLRYLEQQQGVQAGIVNNGDFAMTQRAAGANMSVDVAAGGAWVGGSQTSRQGLYHVINDAPSNVAIPASDPTSPAIHTLYLVVNDSSIAGGSGAADAASFVVQPGAPTAGATLANLTGKNPTVPPNALLLAHVLVPVASASVVNGNIGGFYDSRQPQNGAVAGAPPQYATPPTIGAFANLAAVNIAQTGPGSMFVPFAAPAAADDPDQLWGAGAPTVLSIRRPGLYFIAAYVKAAAMASGNWSECTVFKSTGGVNMGAGSPTVSTFNTSYAPSGLFRCGYGDTLQLQSYMSLTGAVTHPAASLRAEWRRF